MSDIIFEHRTEFVPKEKLEGALEESARLRLHAEALAEALEYISQGQRTGTRTHPGEIVKEYEALADAVLRAYRKATQ